MFSYLKRIIIINKSFRMTIKKYKKRCNIGQRFWYGTPKVEPYNIGFWIFFKTDTDLKKNIESGKTKEIEEYLFNNMLRFGYPKKAFEENELTYDNAYTIINEKKIHSPQKLKQNTSVSFGSEETVKRDYNNDYFIYTK